MKCSDNKQYSNPIVQLEQYKTGQERTRTPNKLDVGSGVTHE